MKEKRGKRSIEMPNETEVPFIQYLCLDIDDFMVFIGNQAGYTSRNRGYRLAPVFFKLFVYVHPCTYLLSFLSYYPSRL